MLDKPAQVRETSQTLAKKTQKNRFFVDLTFECMTHYIHFLDNKQEK